MDKKKAINIVLKVVTWLLVAFTAFMMIFTIVTVTTVDKNDRSIFGMRFYIVKTDSMSLSENNKDMDVHFKGGDIILIKDVDDKYALKAGDIIAFISMNEESYGETVTHMIYEVTYSEDGSVLGYVTYGTNTGEKDDALVEPAYVVGTYSGKIPSIGHFFVYLRTTPGYIICILVPFLLLILYNGLNVIRLFRRYKKEQTAGIEAEKAAIAEERKRNEEMMREILELRAQMEKKGMIEKSPETPASEAEPEREPSDENK